LAPEAVYSFECQLEGSVSMLITDLTCDLDIYVLDDSCDPYTGCLEGSTESYDTDDGVEFTGIPRETYYVVVEAYGAAHLDVASGPCTDDGTATGTVYDPGYTLSFDVSASTGCAEDRDDGLDNDLDGEIDCDDTDCWSEPVCCDVDGDGYQAEDCEGDDGDDENARVYPGAPEDGGTGLGAGDGIDNDCDGIVDEGTLDYDDDEDGFSETEGDCDDADPEVNPDATDEPDNGIDETRSAQTATGRTRPRPRTPARRWTTPRAAPGTARPTAPPATTRPWRACPRRRRATAVARVPVGPCWVRASWGCWPSPR